MAKPKNRSPWRVKLPGKEVRQFRLESQARTYLAESGYTDDTAYPRGALKQLETAFEGQVIRKDKLGNLVRRSETFDTYDEAEKFIAKQDADLDRILDNQGAFEADFETITVREALKKFHATHYKGKASFKENGYRIDHLIEWLGGDRKFRSLTTKDFKNLRATLQGEGDIKINPYSASSQRNYFTVLTSLYKHAIKEWEYPVANLASGITLPKPTNYIQRDWQGDEEVRLMKSLEERSPWLIPIVELSLEMAFRRGELVQGEKNKKTGLQTGGLQWENINWAKGELTLLTEKNDSSKKVTESLGRTVPLTQRMQEILKPLYEASKTKKGLVFQGTTNSVTGAFSNACKRAEPPIEKLTFHSLRKIATKALSNRVDNPMQLRRLTGHRNVEVLDKRYFNIRVEELAALLLKSSGSIQHRGVAALTKVLGLKDTKIFLREVRKLKELDDVFK
ncbi:MAG: tyrosine-type recombinase/integrase [Rhodoferax sp.]|uniref:tyrosine-type recombinase/integrase n=1 Tax=Rhodoferax sp. TaxID=50421 RepID=UPI0030159F8E